jgi:hypothetical protein
MSRGRDIDDRDDPRMEGDASGKLGDLRLRKGSGVTDSDDRDRAGGSSSQAKPGLRARGFASEDRSQRALGDRRELVRFRNRSYWLKADDLTTMREIGRFRTLAEADLAHFQFQGNASRMEYELQNLAGQGLIRRHIVGKETARGFRACVLTGAGKRLLDDLSDRSAVDGAVRQHLYADLKKPTEAFHDTAIYRMYQAESQKIRSSGGRIRRIVLDYELKQKVYAPLARARQQAPETLMTIREEVARENGLKVIDGRIPLPDLRIEYETRDGELEKVDLELATEHYRKRQLAEKARAGFKLYFAGSSNSGTGTVWEDRELTAGILAL